MTEYTCMMTPAHSQLRSIFLELEHAIIAINNERKKAGLPSIPKSNIQLLGQISLLVKDEIASVLSLTQTADLDAFLTMEYVVKAEFKKILNKFNLIYDEDSYLIWLPPETHFEIFIDLPHLKVEAIDPESALVSKAVKAPEKNRQLIREAITTDAFPALVERILKNGGKLENFA